MSKVDVELYEFLKENETGTYERNGCTIGFVQLFDGQLEDYKNCFEG